MRSCHVFAVLNHASGSYQHCLWQGRSTDDCVAGLSLVANTMQVEGTALTTGHRQLHSIVVHDLHCVNCCAAVLRVMNRLFFAKKLAHILLLQPSPWQRGMLTLLRKSPAS